MWELTTVERTDDAWLKEVQEEFRNGCLSDENWNFLHGEPTWASGSSVHGQSQCQQGCTSWYQECAECASSRQKRRRVAHGFDDELFASTAGLSGTCIFATNNLKFETNKLRAQMFAAHTNSVLTYVQAKDVATSSALRKRPDLVQKDCKTAWLQRHDRACGNLYGMLPLAIGMPVALTDHVDRSEKALLRGRIGTVVGWLEDEREDAFEEHGRRVLQYMPKVVYVQFFKENGNPEEWELDGVGVKGVYPITSTKKEWFLDKGRERPVLKIKRQQFPLAPAFAVTAHASQGQTLKNGAIVDLNMSGTGNALTAYVAITRVTKLEDLIIYRPFGKEPFQKGNSKGRETLMKVLRQEYVDWEELIAECMPRRQCSECRFVKPRPSFTPAQWERENLPPVCSECVRSKRNAGTPFQCTQCQQWKEENGFSSTNRNFRTTNTRVCLRCVEKRLCTGKCAEWLPESRFSAHQWLCARRPNMKAKCLTCMPNQHLLWTCVKCNWKQPQEDFAQWTTKHADNAWLKRPICNWCMELPVEDQTWKCGCCKKESTRTGFYALAPREETDKPKNLQRVRCNKRKREA